MARSEIGFKGMNEALRIFDSIPDEITHQGMSAAASKALRPAANAARQKYRAEAKGTQDGYSKTLAIAKMIRVKRRRKKYGPGANMYIDSKLIPVGLREWPAKFYAILLAYGSKLRKTRNTGANRGSTKGKGNFIVEAGKENSNVILSTYKKHAEKEVEKAIEKTIKRIGKR